MPGDPRLRASDADRERTAQLLREHHAVGRLTAEEFNSRVDKALEARTLGELDELLADLPAIDLYQLPSAGIRPTRRGGSGPRLRADGAPLPSLDATWGGWVLGSALLVVVWVVIAIQLGGLAWAPVVRTDHRPVGGWPGAQVAGPVTLGPATATRTAALCVASGPTTRKTAVFARGGLGSLNPPNGPVIPVATSSN
jgi:hypothetical protein